jgi:hypothetical protein
MELGGEMMFRAIVIAVRALLRCSPSGPPPQSDRLIRFPKRCLCLSQEGTGWPGRRYSRRGI